MLGRLLTVMCGLIAAANSAHGFEVVAVVSKIDPLERTTVVYAGGQERSLKFAEDAKFFAINGGELKDGISSELLKAGITVTLTVERAGNIPTIRALRLGGRLNSSAGAQGPTQASVGKSSVGFTPLTEMTAEDRYQGQDGGLYGNGRNELPEKLQTVAEEATAKITPRDTQGQPTTAGVIGLVSISMSNATQEFSRFKQLADADSEKSSHVSVIDCAQGGQTMARWADPQANCWAEADRRLQAAGVSLEQVQVVWVKLANAGPSGELKDHGKLLQRDTETVLANLKKHFPNLQIAYLGSRIYGGWADGRLNPEPYAYEGAFVVRWVINAQLEDNYNWHKAPLALWGPYLWADGLTPRQSDQLVWERSDLVTDGAHPSASGRQKVAEQLLNFFKTDKHARTWFVKQ